jgi:hypothetical protein
MLPGEDNGAWALREARSIPPEQLIPALLQEIADMRPARGNGPLWSYVGDATSNGSTVAHAICVAYGVNPDSGEPLEEKDKAP